MQLFIIAIETTIAILYYPNDSCMLLKGTVKKLQIPKPPLFMSFMQGGEEEAENWSGRHRPKIFGLQYGPGSKVVCHQVCGSS